MKTTFTKQEERAYLTLRKAAERISASGYAAGKAAHLKRGRVAGTYRYTPTEAHRTVLTALDDLGRGVITGEQAMAVLHEYDVFNARFGGTK